MLDSLDNIYLRDKVGFITANESNEDITIRSRSCNHVYQLDQCFSTGVPQHTNLPPNFLSKLVCRMLKKVENH